MSTISNNDNEVYSHNWVTEEDVKDDIFSKSLV